MARGRMVSVTIATDRALNSLSLEAELLYLKAIPHLDRDGLIVGDPDMLQAKIAPRRPQLLAQMEGAITAWEDAGLVKGYDSKDGRVLLFYGFAKNNTIHYEREAPSIHPAPPGYVRTATGLVPETDAQSSVPVQAPVRTNSGPTPAQIPLKVKEVKEREGNSGASAPPAPPMPPAPSAGAGRALSDKLQRLNAKVGPELRLPVADELLRICGLAALAEAETDDGDKARYAAHEKAVALVGMGFKTPDALLRIEEAWWADWRSKDGSRPTLEQFVKLASTVKAGNGRPKEQAVEVYR